MADIESGESAPAGQVNLLPPEPELKGALKPIPEYTPIEMAAGGLGVLAVGTSLASIIVELGSTMVIVAGLSASLLGGYSFYQQTQMTDIRTLKETSEAVKAEVGRLELENKRLKASVDEIGNTIDELKDVERVLDTITATQGQSVDALKEQLEENRQILSTMTKSMKGRVIQNLTEIIYRGDENCDDIISAEEATEVIDSLNGITGLKFHEDRLREKLVGQHVDTLVGLLHHVVNEDLPPEQKIFDLGLAPDTASAAAQATAEAGVADEE